MCRYHPLQFPCHDSTVDVPNGHGVREHLFIEALGESAWLRHDAGQTSAGRRSSGWNIKHNPRTAWWYGKLWKQKGYKYFNHITFKILCADNNMTFSPCAIIAVNFICDHPAIKAISFVGSNQAGEYIYERGSKNGKRVQSNMVGSEEVDAFHRKPYCIWNSAQLWATKSSP